MSQLISAGEPCSSEPSPPLPKVASPAVQQLAFDALASQVSAEAGMGQALEADRVQMWRSAADSWLEAQSPGTEITADELVEQIGLPDQGVYRNNAVGAWFSSKSKARLLHFSGRFRKSSRVIGHGNLQRVWVVG